MRRYDIWNKKDKIVTPSFEIFTAEQWISRYPIAALESSIIVCSAGEINGGFFGTLGQMVQMYEAEGCDFSACTTPEEKLEAIEAFEDQRNTKAAEAAANAAVTEELTATSLASIAASMEYQNMLTLDDVEEEV